MDLAKANHLAQLGKVVAGALAVGVTFAAAWGAFGSRLATAEVRLDVHDEMHSQATARMLRLEQARISSDWHLYVICKGIARGGHVSESECVRPAERP